MGNTTESPASWECGSNDAAMADAGHTATCRDTAWERESGGAAALQEPFAGAGGANASATWRIPRNPAMRRTRFPARRSPWATRGAASRRTTTCVPPCACRISPSASTSASTPPTCPTSSPNAGIRGLDIKSDPRGSLAEFIKSQILRPDLRLPHPPRHHPGQSLPPHQDRKVLFVIEGDALIRMRHIEGGPVTEFNVKGR